MRSKWNLSFMRQSLSEGKNGFISSWISGSLALFKELVKLADQINAGRVAFSACNNYGLWLQAHKLHMRDTLNQTWAYKFAKTQAYTLKYPRSFVMNSNQTTISFFSKERADKKTDDAPFGLTKVAVTEKWLRRLVVPISREISEICSREIFYHFPGNI